MSQAFDAAVVGAGANGLVAATRLARAGLRVVVLEAGPEPGGQGRAVEFAPGFRANPLGQDPGWLPEPIARSLGLDGLATIEVPPVSVLAESGRFLTLAPDPIHAAQAIAPWSAADAQRWPEFMARLHRLAGFLEVLYATPAPDIDTRDLPGLIDLARLGTRFRALGRTEMIELLRILPMSVWELLDDWFECPPLKAGVAAGGVLDHRQGPRSGGTGYVLLHHLVGAPLGSIRGRRPWREGPMAFTTAARGAAQRAGVVLRTQAVVERIDVRNDSVSGVVLAGGETIPVSAVLSTASPAETLLDWIDPVWLDPEFRHSVANIRHRGCTAFVLYGMDATPEFTGLESGSGSNLLLLTPNLVALEKAADAAKYGVVSDAPHIELTLSAGDRTGSADRPVVVARVQYAPHRLREGVWDRVRTESLADRVTAAIAAVSPGFGARVRHRVAWSPADLAEKFGLREGAPSQGELALDQILFMRPVPGWGRHSTPISGLYLGGVGSHPGPGVLGGAGWLAARRMLEDRRRTRSSGSALTSK